MPSPLDSSPDSCAERLFLRGLRLTHLDRLALRALLAAQRLLSLALAQRLLDMRSSDDPLQATLAKAEASALLAHLLREALDILGARLDKPPERQRPHYTPVQRFRILALKSFAGLSQPEAARLFRVSVHTIARWETSTNPASQTVGSTVTAVPPVRRYNDTVHHLVQTLASLGFGASRSLAQHLARAGWKIGKTTAARYLREPRVPGPEMRPTNSAPTQTPKRAVQARFTHHLWHLDLTEIQGFLRSVSFSLAAVLDGAARMPLSWRLFDQRHTADDMTAFADATLTRYGKPRHVVVDHNGAFTAHSFTERIDAWRVGLRFCSADNHRANAGTCQAL